MGSSPNHLSGNGTARRWSGPRFGAAVFVVVAGCYALGAQLAWTSFGAQTTFAFFPPAGITVAALLLLQRRWWWVVLVAAASAELAVDIHHGASSSATLLYIAANTVEPVVGAALTLRWAGPSFDLLERRSVYAFLAGACLVGPLVGGMFGIAARMLEGSATSAIELLAHWCAGDGVSALVVGAPLVILGQHQSAVVRHALDFIVLSALMVGGTILAFLTGLPPVIVALPLLAWAAYRVGVLGVLVAGGLFALVTNYLSGAGYGPVANLDMSEAARVTITQAYIATIVLLAWLISLEATESAVAARDREVAERERDRSSMRAAAAALGNELADLSTLEDVLDRVGSAVQHQLVAAWTSVNLLSADGQYYDTARGLSDEIRRVTTRWPAAVRAPGPVAARTGTPVLIEDGKALRDHYPVVVGIADLTRTEAMAALPLATETGRIGYLAVGWEEPRHFTDSEREYLGATAEVLGRALERVRLTQQREQARQRAEHSAQQHARARHRAETLSDFAAALSSALRPEDVAAAVLEHVRPTLECDAMALGLVGEQRTKVRWLVIDGLPDVPLDEVPTLPLDGDTAVAEALRTGLPIALDDVSRHGALHPSRSDAVRGFVERTGAESFVVWPLSTNATARPLGVLSAFWRTHHAVDEIERSFIGTVATLIAQALIRAQAFIDEEAVAASMQRAVIPTHSPHVDEFEIGAFYRPATRRGFVGGDWYDAVSLPKGRVLFCVGDVVGHGIAAAQDMVQLRNAARAFAMEGHGPARILTELSNVTEHATLGGLATMVLAVWEPVTRELVVASAGHPPPLLRRAGQEACRDTHAAVPAAGEQHADVAEPARPRVQRVLPPAAPPLGVSHTDLPYLEKALSLEADDVLVMFTDGLVERRGENIDDGIDRLVEGVADWSFAADCQDNSLAIVDHCLRTGEQVDDVCLLALRHQPA